MMSGEQYVTNIGGVVVSRYELALESRCEDISYRFFCCRLVLYGCQVLAIWSRYWSHS